MVFDHFPRLLICGISNRRDVLIEVDKLDAEFKYQYQDVHRATFKITEFTVGEKVVWHVLDSHLNFLKDESEWTGTDIVFEITKKNDRTELRFTHVGLAPVIECYHACSNAWGFYINKSLFNLITQGQGKPNGENGSNLVDNVQQEEQDRI